MSNAMEEKRKSPRKKANGVLSIQDRGRSEKLGNLVDLSRDGFMLISKKPINTDKIWQISMDLPHSINGSNTINFGAESLWCDQAGGPTQFWAGFQIIDIDDTEAKKLNQLLDQYLS